MNSSAVTLKDLSSLLGYSVSTVSKALNNKEEISIATRKTIKAMAKKVNYVPNNYAVALRIKKPQSIAVVLPEVTQSPYNQALSYLQKSAENLGYRVLLYQSFDSYTKESEYIKSLGDGSIAGIIVISKRDRQNPINFNNSMPIELLKINSNQSIDKIKALSFNSLNNLLKTHTTN